MKIPWLIFGVLVGALFLRTWPGQNEWGLARELLLWCGSGFLLGLYLDHLGNRPSTAMRITTAAVIMLTWLALGFALN